jgi:hypothetical protein
MSNTQTTSAEPMLMIRRGWRRVIVLTVLALLLLAVGSWAGRHGVMRYQAQQELDQAVAELNRGDSAWRLDDLDAAQKPVDEDKNAALVVLAVKEQLPKGWQSPCPSPQPQHQLRPNQVEELRVAVLAIEEPLAKAASLADCEDGRFPSAASKDGLAASKNCEDAAVISMMLRIHAMLQSQENKSDEAMQSALAIAGASRSIGDERRLIAQQTRLRCRNELLTCVERILAQGEPSKEMTSNFRKSSSWSPIRAVRSRNICSARWLVPRPGWPTPTCSN